MDLSDEEVMGAVAEGSVDHLGVLYERYRNSLFTYFLRFTGDYAHSEDLLQELFLRVLRYRASFDPSRNFRGWVFAIARNVARGPGIQQRPGQMLSLDAEPAGKVPNSFGAPDDGGEAELVRKALLRLSDKDREILLLAKVDGMRYADIAAVVGSSEGAIKVRVHRALKRLAGHLEETRDAGKE